MSSATVAKFRAVSHRRLAEEIADQIERMILNHELQIGDALPPERELAAQLQVSRNILREAITMLAQKGLLEVRPGSGTFVARPSAEFLEDSISFLIRFSKTALYDLLEARLLIEVEIAGLAAELGTEQDIALIAERLTQLEAESDDLDAYVEADIRFHTALARAAKNEIYRLLLSSIRGALRQNIRFFVKHNPAVLEEAHLYHQRILQAIQKRHPEEARAAMRQHLEVAHRGLQELEGQEEHFQSK
ncbi:MAG: FadR family transcriptional regulator [Planctomycetota bacterium]|nr:MAG: FadR family transcriptional regulator [Planctomycetota bacterium]